MYLKKLIRQVKFWLIIWFYFFCLTIWASITNILLTWIYFSLCTMAMFIACLIDCRRIGLKDFSNLLKKLEGEEQDRQRQCKTGF